MNKTLGIIFESTYYEDCKKVAHYTHNLDKKPEGYTNEITYNLQGNNTFQIIFGRTFNMFNPTDPAINVTCVVLMNGPLMANEKKKNTTTNSYLFEKEVMTALFLFCNLETIRYYRVDSLYIPYSLKMFNFWESFWNYFSFLFKQREIK